MSRDQGLCLCWSLSTPAGFELDPFLAKHEPISDTGSASVMSYVRKGKKHGAAPLRDGSEKKSKRKSPAEPR